jgi:hypothetical protein
VFIRCEPGETNPLYTVGHGRSCAPTIDAFRYETVRVRVVQPVRTGRGGIWVVDLVERLPRSDEQVHDADWHNRQYEQVMPPTEDEIRTFVHGFLEARVAGSGAEEYLDTTASVPLLYSTIEGASYDRAEIASLEWGPLWPDGSSRVIVNLFAGDSRVAQPFVVWPGDIGLRLEYLVGDTTQDGLPAPDRFGILGGRVTFDVASPWHSPWMAGIIEGDESILLLDGQTLVVLSDAAVPEGCTAGRLASVNELVHALQNDPDLEIVDVVRTELGGVEAVRLDGRPAADAQRCAGAQFEGTPVLMAHQRDGGQIHPFGVRQGHRLRLYLLDLPGEPARVLTVLLTGPEETFDDLLEAAAPILGSIRFR